MPYERGDLINRIHQSGELLSQRAHRAGTEVVARVNPTWPASWRPYELADAP